MLFGFTQRWNPDHSTILSAARMVEPTRRNVNSRSELVVAISFSWASPIVESANVGCNLIVSILYLLIIFFACFISLLLYIATCRNVICPSGMYCLQDQYLSPHCVNCTWKCPSRVGDSVNFGASAGGDRRHQVCGVDGRSYRNVCEIRRAACRQGRAIPVAYRGPCQGESHC